MNMCNMELSFFIWLTIWLIHHTPYSVHLLKTSGYVLPENRAVKFLFKRYIVYLSVLNNMLKLKQTYSNGCMQFFMYSLDWSKGTSNKESETVLQELLQKYYLLLVDLLIHPKTIRPTKDQNGIKCSQLSIFGFVELHFTNAESTMCIQQI